MEGLQGPSRGQDQDGSWILLCRGRAPPYRCSQQVWVKAAGCHVHNAMYKYQAGHTTVGTFAGAQAVNTHWETRGAHHREHVTRTQLWAHTWGRKYWPHTYRPTLQARERGHTCQEHIGKQAAPAHSWWGTAKACSGSLASWHTHQGHAWHPQQKQKPVHTPGTEANAQCQVYMARAHANNTHQTLTPKHNAVGGTKRWHKCQAHTWGTHA